MTFVKGIQIPSDSDIHALSTLENIQYATKHGVYIIDKEKVFKKNYFFVLMKFFSRILLKISYTKRPLIN